MTSRYEDKVHQKTLVSDVLQDIKKPRRNRSAIRHCSTRCVYLRANQPSSSSLRVGAGSGAPGFVSEIGSLT